jgi:hypothetical protein
MLIQKTKYKDISYVQGFNNVSAVVNNPLFEKLTELSPEYYEIESFKKKYMLNLPIQTGFFILNYAKLKMLQFYYDCIDRYLPRSTFQCLEMDTDSLYMGLSNEQIDNIIKPSKRAEYMGKLKNFCTEDLSILEKEGLWFPRTCCNKHNKYDQRTPGLFKTEYKGELMVSLCSKTYLIVSDGKCKISSKGLNKNHINNPVEIFKKVLDQRKSEGGVNTGFRLRDNHIYTYTQDKKAFSYLYCKRRVLDCGIDTDPLDVTLRPIEKDETKKRSIDIVKTTENQNSYKKLKIS